MRVETRQELHGTVARLLDEVTKCPEDYLHPPDLAQFFGYSANHVNRLFRDLFGEPSLHFIRRLLLERAAFELLNQNLSILEVSQKSQYSEPEAFTKAFRKQFGMPPSIFVRQTNPEWKIPCHSGIHWGTNNKNLPLLQGAEQFGIRLVVREPITIWAKLFIGDFIRIPEAWENRQSSFTKEMIHSERWITVFHDDGLISKGREQMRSHLGFFESGTQPTADFEKITIPGGPFLTTHLLNGPKQHGDAWTFLNRHWVPKKANRLELPGFDTYSHYPSPWNNIESQVWLGLR